MMHNENDKIDGVISWQSIHQIWDEAGGFVPYPQVLQRLVEKRSTTEFWPAALKNIALDLAEKIGRVDAATGLYTIDLLVKNKEMLNEYHTYRKNHSPTLRGLRAFRVWGDIANMGGLGVALSVDGEEIIDSKGSVDGIKHANSYMRFIGDLTKKQLSGIKSTQATLLCREGADEIGGLVICDEIASENLIQAAVTQINEKAEKESRNLHLGNIAHRKAPNDPSYMGVGFVCDVAEVDLNTADYRQRQLEKAVSEQKKVLSQTRSELYGASMVQRVSPQNLSTIVNIFNASAAQPVQPPLCDKLAPESHVIPAIARKNFLEDSLTQHQGFLHLKDLFFSLADLYSGSNGETPYKTEDLDGALKNASMRNTDNVYLIGARQTNFPGVNDKYGHEYCDKLFKQFSHDILDVIREEQNAGTASSETGLFFLEVYKIATKNMLAILTRADSVKQLTQLMHKIDERIALRVKNEGIEDVPHPLLKGRTGVSFVFGALKVGGDLLDEDSIEKFKSDIKDQTRNNEARQILFDAPSALSNSGTSKKNPAP